ncbi:MAG: Wzz/FepE/Etk N-terminal domain-containing protein [Patescibacteria group bacterium]|nr:Wzz/FepE/Etk N-terminal domain-containing protein [Patescibacteria group bacterium]
MDELKDLVKVVGKYRPLFVFLILVGGGGAFIVSALLPVKYEAATTVYVGREPQKPVDQYYTYDGFYSQQASMQYTDTVVGLLKTPDVYRTALEKGGGEQISALEFLNSTEVRKVSPQVINISVVRKEKEESRRLLTTLSQTVSEKIKSLNQQGDNNFFVSSVKADPLVTTIKQNYLLNTFVGMLLGMVFGFSIMGLVEYLKKP